MDEFMQNCPELISKPFYKSDVIYLSSSIFPKSIIDQMTLVKFFILI